MAYDMTDEQLLATAQQVNEQPVEGEYDMGRRHEFEITALEAKKRDEQALLAEQQAVYGNQLQSWENQGVLPENLARAKAQLSRYFPSASPQPQKAPIYSGEAAVSSPTQADLVNPASPAVKYG